MALRAVNAPHVPQLVGSSNFDQWIVLVEAGLCLAGYGDLINKVTIEEADKTRNDQGKAYITAAVHPKLWPIIRDHTRHGQGHAGPPQGALCRGA